MTSKYPNDPEHRLESLLGGFLVPDFVFRSPWYYEGPRKKEVCDLVIEHRAHALPIQLKTQGRNRDDSQEARWLVHATEKVTSQCYGAARKLARGGVQAEHLRRGVVPLQVPSEKLQHLLAVYDVRGRHLLPARLCAKASPFLHHISAQDLVATCRELVTVPDMFRYLHARAECRAIPGLALNEEFLVFFWYLRMGTLRNLRSASAARDHFDRHYDDGARTLMRRREEDNKLARMYQRFILGALFDPKMQIAGTPEWREKTAFYLNSVSRVTRRELMRQLLQLMDRADQAPYASARIREPGVNVVFVIMASGLSEPARLRLLSQRCAVALAADRARGLRSEAAVGVVAPPRSAPELAHLFCVIDDCSGVSQLAIEQELKTISRETAVVFDELLRPTHADRLWGPNSLHDVRAYAKEHAIELSAACPCGGGLEYGKCHGRV